MTERIKQQQIELWRKEGAVVVPEFFESEEIDAVVKDFQVIFPNRQAASLPIDNKGSDFGTLNSGIDYLNLSIASNYLSAKI